MKSKALLLCAVAGLIPQSAMAYFSKTFLDPCNNGPCSYPTAGYPGIVPPGYPRANSPPLYYGADNPTPPGNNPVPGDDLVGSESLFDVLNLRIQVIGDNLVASVMTRFVEGPAVADIYYGDLMISTLGWAPYGTTTGTDCSTVTAAAPYDCDAASNSGTTWNYVVKTDTGAIYQTANSNLVVSDDAPHGSGSFKGGQYVRVDTTGLTAVGSASVANDAIDLPDPNTGTSKTQGRLLTYTLALSDIGLSNPYNSPFDIALRWTMTCANDIVEASTHVPEPVSLSLMLGGLAGIRVFRRSMKPNPRLAGSV